MKKLFLSLMALVLSMTALAQEGANFVGSDPTQGGDFYLYNVKTGLWLGENDCRNVEFGYMGDKNWTTHAELTTRGRLFTVEKKDNGTYRLNGHFGGNKNLNDGNLFLDTGTDADWVFTLYGESTDSYKINATYGWRLCAEMVGDKPYSFAQMLDNEANAGNYRTGHEMLEGSDEWKFVSRADRLAWVEANATAENPIDVSFLVVGGPLCNADDYEDVVWQGDWKKNNWAIFAGGADDGPWRRVYETWAIDNKNIYQTITDIPAGKYGVNADAVYVSTAGANMSQAEYDKYVADPVGTTKGFVYGQTGEIIGTTPMINAYAISPSADQRNTNYWATAIWENKAQTADAELIVEGNSLNVGVKVDGAGGTGWIIFDNIGLNYYGKSDLSDYTDALQAVIDEAKVFNQPTTDALKAALATAITDAEAKLTSTDKDEIVASTETLSGVMNTINAAVDNYNALVEYVGLCEEANAEGNADFTDAIAVAKAALKEALTADALSAPMPKLRMYRRIVGGGHHNITIASATPADQLECMIYNVGAGLFLTGGNQHGTHATLNYTSPIMKLHAKDGGNFAIQTNLPNGTRGVNDFLNYGGFVDTNVQDSWKFEAVGDGTYRIINASNTGENIYLGMTESEYLQVDTDKSGADNKYNIWKLISVEQLKAMEKNATPENPVDVTYLVKESYFGKWDYKGDTTPTDAAKLSSSYWTCNFTGNWTICYYGNEWATFNSGDRVFEIWNSSGATSENVYKLQQTITGLRPGKYRVSVDGFYRYGDHVPAAEAAKAGTAVSYAYIFGNDAKQALKLITDESGKNPEYDGGNVQGYNYPQYPDQGAKAFQYGLFDNHVDVVVGADGVLTLGISKDGSVDKDWIVVDNFRLAYLGSDVATVKEEIGYATYVAPFDIAEIPTGVEAYAGKLNGNYVELLPVTQIPEGTAVILKSTGGEYTFTQTIEAVALGQENELKVVTPGLVADGTQYVLAKPEGKDAGFYRVITGDAIPVGKGYLVIAGANAKLGYTFSEEGVVDNIDAVDTVIDGAQTIFNLQGQKMTKPVKGINIINGKKVIIK